MSQSAIKDIKPLGFPWVTQDPFIFCVHHADAYPKGNDVMGPAASLSGRNIGQDFTIKDGWRMYHGSKVPGFPAHPHVGFETVTVATKGLIDHSDSMGAAGRFGNGDVQWMTAGKGVQHCEMFPLLSKEKENPLELFQIWLNLPKKNKKVTPHFAMLWADTIPTYTSNESGKTEVRVIAGKIESVQAPPPTPDSWAADAGNEVAIWLIKMEADAQWQLPEASSSVNRTLYFYSGKSVEVASQNITIHQAIELHPDREASLKNGNSESFFLLLQGKPIAEPIVQYGPFVVNQESEVQEVMQEFRQSQFGGWPWPSHEHVHPREMGRFAKYPDGKLIEKTT
ncbi:MAG: pirin family protein [Flammeovirgaceae bacterium]|nr:pirin family protein [Flammeovirgaceae bacterium]